MAIDVNDIAVVYFRHPCDFVNYNKTKKLFIDIFFIKLLKNIVFSFTENITNLVELEISINRAFSTRFLSVSMAIEFTSLRVIFNNLP